MSAFAILLISDNISCWVEAVDRNESITAEKFFREKRERERKKKWGSIWKVAKNEGWNIENQMSFHLCELDLVIF